MSKLLFVLPALLMLTVVSHAAVWQWSVTVDSVISSETKAPPRAFLYIPSDCQRVRAVVVGQHNMQEEQILEHPAFRKAADDLGFALVWVTPMFDRTFRFDQQAGEHFDTMMRQLADVSGYSELATAPIVPIGHSAAASFPWNFAAWNPARTLAAISVSGQWAYFREKDSPDWGDRNIDGVPGLVTMGEYEWAADNAAKGLAERTAHPNMPLSMLGCEADGHFAALDDKVEYLALYLRKAAEFRLPDSIPADGPIQLKPIDPTQQGWLADRYHRDAGPRSPAAPVGQYTGNLADAFWYFDQEHARATETFGALHRGKSVAVLAYIQEGVPVAQNNQLHQQVPLKFLPLPDGDGLTFKLTCDFETTVPDGRPVRWTGKKAGEPLSHPTTTEQIKIHRICGPVEQVGPDTWAIRHYRMGMDNPKRSNDIWFVMTHPGDDTYKRSVQQASMRFPLTNTRGADQRITFPALSSEVAGTSTIQLRATSDSGLPVLYYVREGPAEISGNTLQLTAIPARAKLPIKVTVVAWQWGRSIEPLIKTASPVEQSFYVTR